MRKNQIILASKDKCTGCSACVSLCPKNCISMREDKEGFLQPKIDHSKCIKCHKCEHTCPILIKESVPDDFETKAFAAINKDGAIRKESSSGGVFFALAKCVIDRGGVVFGARWNDTWEVVHDFADSIEGVKAFMKSKYVQSRIGNAYLQAKMFLDGGRWVLFSGTPCQLAGLRAILGKGYERLLQVDLICHGVPSPKVWRKYLESYFSNEKILSINMREKGIGWDTYRFQIVTDSREYLDVKKSNPFIIGFLNNSFLRNSCYQCTFRHYHRASDITIADYWGVKRECPEMYDGKGTSIVFCHTDKAFLLLNKLSDELTLLTQEKVRAIRSNKGMETNEILTDKHARFYRLFKLTSSFKLSEYPVFKDALSVRVIRKLKKILA